MLLNLRKGSIGDELSRFFDVLHEQSLAEAVTPSAFCQARKKVNPRALMGLNRPLHDGFQRHSIARKRAPPLVARSSVPVSAETILALHRHRLVQLPMGAARGGGAPPASGTTGSVASTGGGVSAGRNRGASGIAGSLASSVFLVRSEEGAPEGTLLRSVVGTFESDPSPAHAKDGVATAIPTRIASIAWIRFMIIPPLAPEERFRWMSYITP